MSIQIADLHENTLRAISTNGHTRKVRILSIDGGGIRGVLPAQILAGLEQTIRELEEEEFREELPTLRLSQRDEELELARIRSLRVSDYFDFVAGTSTGGLIASLMLSPNYTCDAPNMVDLFTKYGPQIFSGKSWLNFFGTKYRSKGIEDFLQRNLQDVLLSQLTKPCLLTAYETWRRKPFFFRQHRAILDPAHDFVVRDAARATSAAPTYFKPVEIKSETRIRYPLIDGGVFANNPTLCAIVELLTIKPSLSMNDLFIFSLGTGGVREPYEFNRIKSFHLVKWAAPLIDFMMSGAADSIDYQIRKIYEIIEQVAGQPTRPATGYLGTNQYVRIDPDLLAASPKLDDASESNLDNLQEAGRYALEEYQHAIEHCANQLIDNKQP